MLTLGRDLLTPPRAQGLADLDPDVDAIWRLVAPERIGLVSLPHTRPRLAPPRPAKHLFLLTHMCAPCHPCHLSPGASTCSHTHGHCAPALPTHAQTRFTVNKGLAFSRGSLSPYNTQNTFHYRRVCVHACISSIG
jgi:hypothetical protein